MRITHSTKISEFLTALAERKQLKDAKDVAVWHTATSRTNYIEEFAVLLNRKYGGLPDLVAGTARTSGTTLYFEGTETETMAKLRAIKPRKEGKTAPKVLARMIYTRLVKLKKELDYLTRAQKAGKMQSYLMQYEAPEITRESMISESWFQRSTPLILQTATKVANVTLRDDVTDEIRNEAWRLFQVHTIMDS